MSSRPFSREDSLASNQGLGVHCCSQFTAPSNLFTVTCSLHSYVWNLWNFQFAASTPGAR